MTKMDSAASPLVLNNQCVALMDSGNYLKAIECARNGIRFMQRQCGAKGSGSNDCTSRQDLLNPQSPVTTAIFPVQIFAVASIAQLPDDQTTSGIFVVYSKAFCFTKQDFDYANMYGKETAAILFYNLALANHLYAMALPARTTMNAKSASSSKTLPTALHIYQLSLQALTENLASQQQQREESPPPTQPKPDGTILLHVMMAVLSNMGHALMSLARPEEARSCLDSMEQIWAGKYVPLDDDDIKFFATTIACKRACGLIVAPAA